MTKRRWFASTLAVVSTAWAVSLAAVVIHGGRDTARPAATIVVLGAAHYAGRPSPVLRARLDHAASLFDRGLADHVILTGGKAPGDIMSEAEAGRAYLRQHGVPVQAMMLESEGRSTEESMRAAARLMRSRGLRDGILVSDPFHLLRLRILAWRFGMRAYTSPTRTSPISANRREAAEYMINESFKAPLAALEAIWATFRS